MLDTAVPAPTLARASAPRTNDPPPRFVQAPATVGRPAPLGRKHSERTPLRVGLDRKRLLNPFTLRAGTR